MTDKLNEHLSALIDNEDIDAKLLDRILKDDEQRSTLGRYQLASSIIRNDAQAGMNLDISSAVAAQIDKEAAHKPVLAKSKLRAANDAWWKPAASFAVAASVALVTVIGVSNYQLSPEQSGVDNPAASNPVFETAPLSGMANPVSFNSMQEAPVVQGGSDLTEQRRRIQSFFVDHQQQTQLSQQDKVTEEAEGDKPDSEQ